MGFSIEIGDAFYNSGPVTCSVVDANHPTTVFASSASQIPGNNNFIAYAVTQDVT